jgi:phage terminase large subunit-like protein
MILSELTEAEAEQLLWDWKAWARPNQLAPEGDWLVWLVLAGRGFGKTRCGAECIRDEVTSGRSGRIALVAETQKDLEEVMVFGESGINSVFPPHQRPRITKKPIRIEFHNGAVATGYNATEPDQLRGPQFDFAWGDEMCFVSGTLIETESGPQPIESIRRGHMVWTRSGLKRVSRSWMSAPYAELWKLRTHDGRELVGTAKHPIFTEANGFVPLRSLQNGVMLRTWQASEQFGVDRRGISTATTTATARASFSIARSIRTLTGLCPPKLKSIILMAISSITRFRTYSRSRGQSMFCLSPEAALSIGMLGNAGPIRQRKSGQSEKRPRWFAKFVVTLTNPLGCDLSSVRQNAKRRTLETVIPGIANDTVASVVRAGKGAVYNIEVEGAPEYFANGILVHNCKWRYARETWDQLQFGLRLGNRPRQIVTTTPRPIQILKEIIASAGTVITRGVTTDNRANLAPSFIKTITAKYAGTRLGRQELSAEILDDVPDALWTRAALDRDRRKPDKVPELKRVVVAIDPAAKKNEVVEDGAATGIVVAAVGEDGRGYVLDDATCRESPNGWARKAVACFDRYDGDCIVGEVNNGGDMVESTVRVVRSTVPFKAVHASRGKWTRAEPVAALYEQGRISHVGTFAELEDEMVNFGPNGMVGDQCCDRVDALVWALTELFPALTRKAVKAEPKTETPKITSPTAWMA